MLSLRSTHTKLLVTILFFAAISVSPTIGSTPPTITFQGRLTDANGFAVADGAYVVRLAIYDAQSAGALLWETGEQAVLVRSGLFTYILGSNVSFPVSLFSGAQRFLGISVGADSELTPRIPFRSAPYAFEASHSDSSEVASWAHTSLKANQADTALYAQLSSLAESAARSIWADSTGLADSAKISASANLLGGLPPNFYLDWNGITNMPAGFADGVDDGASFSAGDGLQLIGGEFAIVSMGVTEQLLADDAVTNTKIAANAVGSSEVQNNSLTSSDLAANSVGASEIENGSITSIEMAPNSIGSVELITGSIDSTKIADSSITGADIAPNSIGSTHLQSTSFSSAQLLDEPGVAQINGASFLTAPLLTTVSSLSITAPANGYVLAMANFEMGVDHVFGIASQAIVGLSTSSSSLPGDQNKNFDIPNSANSGKYTSLVSLQRIFPVNAGANTFYLLGRKTTSSSPIWATFDVTFTLVYYSTSYGTVSTSPPVVPPAPDSPQE